MTKILLVEDDKSLREIYGVRLLAEGYDIISAGDGEEALAVAIKDRPALIVSDVMMPKISGFDMLDILRSTTETRDVKVIMMTALSSDDQRRRGESLGADRYLVKSQVGIEDVVRTVHEVLGDAPGATSPSTQVATPAPAPAAADRAPAPAVNVPRRENTAPAPAVSPAPAPQAPVTPQPSNTAPAQLSSNPLPQPTAPFSTKRPNGLGDRVIQPLTPQASDIDAPTIADQMSQELGVGSDATLAYQAPTQSSGAPSVPVPTTTVPAQTTPTSIPIVDPATGPVDPMPQSQLNDLSSDEADLTSHLKFEESPREQSPPQPPQPPQSPTVN